MNKLEPSDDQREADLNKVKKLFDNGVFVDSITDIFRDIPMAFKDDIAKNDKVHHEMMSLLLHSNLLYAFEEAYESGDLIMPECYGLLGNWINDFVRWFNFSRGKTLGKMRG